MLTTLRVDRLPQTAVVHAFTEHTRAWFSGNFARPTRVQAAGWEAIARGSHALLVAPTGSGKTLAAFLWALDALSRLPANAPPGVRVLYVSPLKALVYDVERNLRAPLAGLVGEAERLGSPVRAPRVAIRTGDTPARERARMTRDPPDILVTTPESLFLLLGSRMREHFRHVHTVIVDEVHALAPTKRGAHLALSLERLAEIAERDPQRIGLSATVRPSTEVARFLCGGRDVSVVDASARPALELEVRVPVPDMRAVQAPPRPRRGAGVPAGRHASGDEAPRPEHGMWSAIEPALLADIRANRTTIVFVNSRALCERLCQRLNELAGEELVRAHHGSVSHEQRAAIEESLKRGELRAIVATSSLELGIDMGAVDLVVLVESPGSVARGLQRVGRAGHQVGAASRGRIYPKFRGDLLECAVIAARMCAGEIEALRVPRLPLDVLAQQVVAMCCERPRTVDEIYELARRTASYADLSADALGAVLDMLSGRYPSSEFADLRPLLAFDRARGLLRARRGAPLVSRVNAGTIPDRGNYAVHLGEDGPRIGELDEEMVFETRVGDTLLLGASSWRVQAITRDRVLVAPAPGEPGRLPFWRGDGPGRPLALGRALGAFVREVGAREHEEAVAWVRERAPLDAWAAGNLVDYVHEQRAHTGTLPTDRAITVERFHDELGDWRVCILTPFGARVHAPWALALQRSLEKRGGFEVQVMYTDDGIVLRMADTDEAPPLAALLPDPEEAGELVTAQLADSALFAGLFRENAARALLLPRRRPERRNPLWAQRLKAQQLLAAVRRYPAFPIVLETHREALADVFDLAAFDEVLRGIRSRELRVHEVETPSASPFARSLVFAYVAAFIYEQDAPLAERKAQALTLDRGLLAELLGQAELRDLIDAGALAELETELQHLAPGLHARDADELHDLLRRLGDLEEAEAAARCDGGARAWLAELAAERRAVRVVVAGAQRWVAAEDVALYRDALGCVPPDGLPANLLDPVADAPVLLLRRYARTHGPFLARDAAARLGLTAARVEPALAGLLRDGLLVCGEIRPGGVEPEWCDTEVLRRLKRRTLARLRHQAAAVDGRTLARFLPAWHGVGLRAAGPGRLENVLAQLEGLALPWSSLALVMLPARVPDFDLDSLDMLCATGRVVWVGRGALGPRDGRVAVYRRERARLLLEAPAAEPEGEVHRVLLAHLRGRGASFLFELEEALAGALPSVTRGQFETALWDLVWAGHVTNDTFAPLRGLGRRARAASGPRRGAHGLAGGRWSLVAKLRDAGAEPTERVLARANMLLERYGVVSRECAGAEESAGGFAPLYRVLRAMEDAGRVRRGWFVDGLSGAQFAHAGAVERLRACRPEDDPSHPPAPLLLAAVDPANPYGALLPWPETADGGQARPRRVAGAWVALVDGAPVLYAGPAARQVLTFAAPGDAEAALRAAFAALATLPRAGRRGSVLVERIDGNPARESPHAPLLLSLGYTADYRGMLAPFQGR